MVAEGFTTAFVTGQTVYYAMTDGTNWEVGKGTFTAAGPTLSVREQVFCSSNAGALVNFPGSVWVWDDLNSHGSLSDERANGRVRDGDVFASSEAYVGGNAQPQYASRQRRFRPNDGGEHELGRHRQHRYADDVRALHADATTLIVEFVRFMVVGNSAGASSAATVARSTRHR